MKLNFIFNYLSLFCILSLFFTILYSITFLLYFYFIFYFFIGPMEEIRRKTLLQGNDTFHGNGNQTGLFSSLRNSKLLSHITEDSFNQGEEREKWKNMK